MAQEKIKETKLEETKKVELSVEEKKPEVKKDTKASDTKAEAKKEEIKKEEKKPEVKKEEPKKEDKKPEVKKEEEKPASAPTSTSIYKKGQIVFIETPKLHFSLQDFGSEFRGNVEIIDNVNGKLTVKFMRPGFGVVTGYVLESEIIKK